MTEVQRVVDQLNRAFEGGAWHGPAVLELLKDVSAEQAAARPFDEAHSIWELVLHIAAWVSAGGRRLAGDHAQLAHAENWPAVTDTSDQAWADAQDALKEAREELRSAISLLDETRLEQPIIEGMSSVYVTLHGVIQHSLYHAGQIAILKKATAKRQTP